jgi:hypothetical protein
MNEIRGAMNEVAKVKWPMDMRYPLEVERHSAMKDWAMNTKGVVHSADFESMGKSRRNVARGIQEGMMSPGLPINRRLLFVVFGDPAEGRQWAQLLTRLPMRPPLSQHYSKGDDVFFGINGQKNGR